jgi:hypothetical protein
MMEYCCESIEKFEDTKRVSEAVNLRWTDNTMVKRKTMIYKTVHRKLKT